MKEAFIFVALLALAAIYQGSGTPAPSEPAIERPAIEKSAVEHSVHYSGCNEVRALGKAPLYAGQPGYREDMDGDGDGIACEPNPVR